MKPWGILRWLRACPASAAHQLALLVSATRVRVDGNSMRPVLADGDHLLVGRLAYSFAPPRRGDIVLLRDPSRPGFECIKRIVGLPGELLDADGRVLPLQTQDRRLSGAAGWLLSANEYFVVGDNRSGSTDSRVYGPVPAGAIVGQVWYRYAGRGPRGRLA